MRRWLTLVCTPALAALALAGRAGAATFTVTNTNDSGMGSLRAAIQGANATDTTDTIAFAIPGAGGHTISVTSRESTWSGTGTTRFRHQTSTRSRRPTGRRRSR